MVEFGSGPDSSESKTESLEDATCSRVANDEICCIEEKLILVLDRIVVALLEIGAGVARCWMLARTCAFKAGIAGRHESASPILFSLSEGLEMFCSISLCFCDDLFVQMDAASTVPSSPSVRRLLDVWKASQATGLQPTLCTLSAWGLRVFHPCADIVRWVD